MPKITRGKLSGVSISQFVLDEPDFVWFHYDIIFCLESDYIVVSFSLGTKKLRVLSLNFGSNISPAISCHRVLFFLLTTYELEITY